MTEISPMASALGRLPSGLFIFTTGTEGQATGFLASFVQQVGFQPPAISVAIHRDRQVLEVLRGTGAFCLSVLSESSKSLLGHFARGFGPGEPAFEGLETALSADGVPYLSEANAYLVCKLVGEQAWSDHILFCGEVVGGACQGEEQPLLHLRKTGLSY